MRLPQALIETFSDFVERDLPVALVTVLSTDGSTYSKAGSQMLIGQDGDTHGLLSGGCLENDLAERAVAAIRSGQADWIEYDLRQDDDVFGLGVGCEGAMHLQILPLRPESGYEPFAGWLAALDESLAVDARFDLPDDAGPVLIRIERPHAVLVLGGGQDAVPLMQLCGSLGWRVTLSDHRPAYAQRLRDQSARDVHCLPAWEINEHLPFDRFDAAIVMSHHLASDRQYLRILAESPIDFVGLLGPPHRRDRLLDEIGHARAELAGRLRSPVGKRIGGRGPAAIALEVAAELQEYFCSLNAE